MDESVIVNCGAKGSCIYAFEFRRNDLQRYAGRLQNDYKNSRGVGKVSFWNNARHERIYKTITRLLNNKSNNLSLESICSSIKVSRSSMLAYLRNIKYGLNSCRKICQD